MSKLKTKLLSSKYIFIGMVVLTTVFAWDLVEMASTNVEEGTYRLESEFDGYSGATTSVAVVPSDYSGLSATTSRTDENISEAQIALMVEKAIELQGGFAGVISKGDKVMIKPNLVGADEPAGTGENTDYRVVKALVIAINDYTEGDVEIIIGESTARVNHDPTKEGSVWHNSGYVDMAADLVNDGIDVSLLDIGETIDDLVDIDLGSKAVAAPFNGKYKVHKALKEVDVFITCPVLKIHDTGITCALKNQIGTAPGSYYGYNKKVDADNPNGLKHDVAQRRWTTEEIVDLCKIASIDFVVVDAIMCLELKKNDEESNRVRYNTILAGQDPVAIDHVCAQLMSLNPDDVAHITLAEKVGIGTNNPDLIYVEGASIADVKKKVRKSTDLRGVYGQSNRTWILSPTYAASDITTVGITDEANYKPAQGVESWSMPTYFFDDRIDLTSYYNAATDVVSYAFTYFYAPKAQTAELWVLYDEGMRVYVNGTKEFEYTSSTSLEDEQRVVDKIDININKGWNTLLVKNYQKYGEYEFGLNICDPASTDFFEGNRVQGLVFVADTGGYTHPGVGTEITIANSKSNISAYPNPCRNMVTISLNATELQIINVYNIKGQVVKSFTAKQNITWNLISESGKTVSTGQYIIRNENTGESTRLIVR